MRSLRLLLCAATVACGGCGPQLPSAGPVATPNCQPLAGSNASPEAAAVSNGTSLVAEPLPSPTSPAHVYFATPELGEEIPIEASRSYPVTIACDGAGDDSVLIDVALDGGRPRQRVAPRATIALEALIAADEELAPGVHWLFAAPVLGSGLVPRPAAGSARAAVARRFFVGKSPIVDSGPTGAVWLRKPEGTYNGPRAGSVLFDVFVFSAAGNALDLPYTLALHGPTVSGELRLPSPFTVHDVPSGDYEIAITAATAKPSSMRFAVNRELGGVQ